MRLGDWGCGRPVCFVGRAGSAMTDWVDGCVGVANISMSHPPGDAPGLGPINVAVDGAAVAAEALSTYAWAKWCSSRRFGCPARPTIDRAWEPSGEDSTSIGDSTTAFLFFSFLA